MNHLTDIKMKIYWPNHVQPMFPKPPCVRCLIKKPNNQQASMHFFSFFLLFFFLPNLWYNLHPIKSLLNNPAHYKNLSLSSHEIKRHSVVDVFYHNCGMGTPCIIEFPGHVCNFFMKWTQDNKKEWQTRGKARICDNSNSYGLINHISISCLDTVAKRLLK